MSSWNSLSLKANYDETSWSTTTFSEKVVPNHSGHHFHPLSVPFTINFNAFKKEWHKFRVMALGQFPKYASEFFYFWGGKELWNFHAQPNAKNAVSGKLHPMKAMLEIMHCFWTIHLLDAPIWNSSKGRGSCQWFSNCCNAIVWHHCHYRCTDAPPCRIVYFLMNFSLE